MIEKIRLIEKIYDLTFISGIGVVIGGILALFGRIDINSCTERQYECLADNPAASWNCTSWIKDHCTCAPADSPDNH